MISGKTLIGAPIYFKDICLVYPPLVKDVIVLENRFNEMLSSLTESQEDITDMINEEKSKPGSTLQISKIPTPLENLFLRIGSNSEKKKLVESAFLFFTKEKVLALFDLKFLVIGDVKEQRILNEDNFFDFQNAIRLACGKKVIEKPNPDEDPRVTQIKSKQRLRDKVKAKQDGEKKGQSFELILMSLIYRNIGLTPLNIGDIPYATVYPLSTMGQNKEKYQNDINSLLAGAKNVHPKYWVADPDTD